MKGAGFEIDDYNEPKTSEGWARGAESLANYLWRKTVRPEIFGSNMKRKILNREGIASSKIPRVFERGTEITSTFGMEKKC